MFRISRAVAGLAMAGLLGLTAACGGSGAPGSGVTTGSADPAETAVAKKSSGRKADGTVAGTGMKGGCEAVRKAFAAIEAGDLTTANKLKDKGAVLFDDVAAKYATTNLDLAKDGAMMGSELGFELPTDPTKYRSALAQQYAAICVARYRAAALTPVS